MIIDTCQCYTRVLALPVQVFSLTAAMDSLRSLLQPLHLSLNHRHSTPFYSFSFLSPPPPPLPPFSSSSSSTFRLSPIRASHSPKKNHAFHKPKNPLTHVLQTLNLFFSPLLKTICIAAALFLMRLHLKPPALAAATPPPPPAESMPENLSGEENSSKIEELRSLVEAKIRERKIDEAIGIIDQLTELEPEELDWPLLKAHLCARNGDHASARNLFEEVLKRDPFCVVALHGLLVATSELKEPTKGLLPRFEEAVRFFESEKRDSEMRDMKLLIAQVIELHIYE